MDGPKTRQKRPVQKYLLIALALLVGLEPGLRVLGYGDPPIATRDNMVEYYLSPDRNYTRFGNRISINRYGMRSEDFDKDQKYENRVYLIGDSIVYGNHHLDQSETLSSLIKTGSSDVSGVASIAASSWGPENMLAYLEKFGPFKGQTAVLVLSTHDRYDIAFTSTTIPYKESPPLSAITDIAATIYQRIRSTLSGQPSLPEAPVRITHRAITETLNHLSGNFERVVLVHHLARDELVTIEDDVHENYFREIALAHNAFFIDTRPLYSEQCGSKQIYHDDIHLSAEGSSCLADEIIKHL